VRRRDAHLLARRRSLAWCCLGALLYACDDSAAAAPIPELEPCMEAALDRSMIEVHGDRFVLDGRDVVPHGVNSYPLLQHAGEGRWDAIEDVFDQAVALGRPFVRTNAFMDGGENPARLREDDGTIREEGLRALDGLIAEAARFDVRLLLVLTNNWADYGGAPAVVQAVAPGEDLPKDAFWSDRRAIEAQREFIRAVVSRENSVTSVPYRDDPTIFLWELANEARCTDARYCTRDTLMKWARVMADAVRDAGARQPIAWGGSGYRGKYGEDLAAIADDGAVDVLTLHMYPGLSAPWNEAFGRAQRVDAARALGASAIYDRAALAGRYAMPLLIEELGYLPPASVTGEARDRERAEVFSGLLAVAHAQRVAAFPWMIGERARTDYDGHLIRPGDAETCAVLTCEPP
jgi:mannan endo-1,4-beta-mannosidase